MCLRADWCSHAAATYAVKEWHYSRSLPTPPLVKIGIWEGGSYVGCVLFSRGNAANMTKAFNLKQTEMAELSRIALGGHSSPVSKVIKVSLAMLRALAPGLRLVVSYADTAQGHHGGVYQAAGWVYIGSVTGSPTYLAPDGKMWHSRMVSSTGIKKCYGKRRRVWRSDECQKFAGSVKHKYLMPLDKAMRRQIEPLRQPYPKRPSDGEPAAPPQVGGSSPTRTLQPSGSAK